MSKSKRNLNIVSGILLPVGIALMIIGLIFGASTTFYLNSTGFHISGPKSHYKVEKKFDVIDRLTIDTSFSEVEIKKGTENKVVLTGSKKFWIPAVEVVGKELDINSTKNGSGISFGIMGIPDNESKITIYLTEDTKLIHTKIDVSFSQVTITDITSDKLNLQNSFGEIISNTITKHLSIDNSFGNIKANLSAVKTVDVDASFGDVTLYIDGSKSSYAVKSNSSFGEINTEDNGTKLSDNRFGTITLDNSFGNINLKFLK